METHRAGRDRTLCHYPRLFFGLFLFVLSRAYSNPPFPWYWTLTGQLVAGIVYGFVSWFLTMRLYARARGQR